MYSIAREPQYSLERTEKRIFKRSQKKRENERVREWTKFEKLSYAKALLKTMIHDISIDESFYLYLGRELSRTPRQVYGFHRNMISEFKNKKDIVRELLGQKFRKVSLKSDNVSIRAQQKEDKRRKGPVFQWESSIDTDIPQCIFQSEDLTFFRLFYSSRTPQTK